MSHSNCVEITLLTMSLSSSPPSLLPFLGTEVIRMTATDADDPTYGNSARVVYSILQGQPYFSVEAKTGMWAQGTFGKNNNRTCINDSNYSICVLVMLVDCHVLAKSWGTYVCSSQKYTHTNTQAEGKKTTDLKCINLVKNALLWLPMVTTGNQWRHLCIPNGTLFPP